MNALSKYLLEEASAIAAAAEKLNGEEVEKALSLLNNCSQNNSKLIISELVRNSCKKYNNLSVGLTSIYLNPLDALHDIGIVNKGDVCLLIKQWRNFRILEIIQHLKTRKTSCIAITVKELIWLNNVKFSNAQVDKRFAH